MSAEDPGSARPDVAVIDAAIQSLLADRADDATLCPSEVARVLERPGVPWRSLMDVRAAAARLVDEGQLLVMQGGQAVDPATARGPIRLRRRHSGRGSP